MKRLGRLLGIGSAFLGALTTFRTQGRLTPLLMGPKDMAAGLAPWLMVSAGLGTLLMLVSGDCAAIWVGVLGVYLARRHITRTAKPHRAFEPAFGRGWQDRIPPQMTQRMLKHRFAFPQPDPPAAVLEQDVRFGTHVETGDDLLCDLWQPPEGVQPSGLGVIYFHGSGWHFVDKDMGTRRFFGHLAGQGHTIMDVAYTLAPKADMHGMLADVKRAIAWLKSHGAEYGVNPQRIVLMGGSAGAHLALLAAYAHDHPELQTPDVTGDTSVRAVVSYYGIADLVAFHRYSQSPWFNVATTPIGARALVLLTPMLYRERFIPEYGRWVNPSDMMPSVLGGTPDEIPERYRLYSPISHVGPNCPPTLLLCGAHDMANLAAHARRLHAALTEAGAQTIHIEYPDSEHGFDLMFPKWSPAAQAATYDVQRFLALMT